MQRPTQGSNEAVSQMRFVEASPAAEAWPRLWEFLLEDRWDDGSVRETGTLLLFAEGSRWKACLHDRAVGRSAFVTGDTPEGLLGVLEAGLGSDGLDWRARPPRSPSKGGAGK